MLSADPLSVSASGDVYRLKFGFSKPLHPDQFVGCHPKSEFMAWQLTALLMDIGTMGLIQNTKSSHHILARLFLSLM